MSIALDLGTHACRSLRSRGNSLAARRSRSIAAHLVDGEVQRTWMKRLQIPFIPCDDHLLVPGDFAEQLTQLFPVPCHDLLADGKVPYSDPVTRQLIAVIVDSLLPAAEEEGEVCCFTHPGYGQRQAPADPDFDRRIEFVSRLIRLRGYEPLPVNPAVALALAEMEPEQYTGISLSLGASGCDLALVRRGNPVATLRVPRGGRWIDEALARHSGLYGLDLSGQRVLDLEAARRRREAMSLGDPRDDERRLVVEFYRNLIEGVTRGIVQLDATDSPVTRSSSPLPIVFAGGVAQFDEFGGMLRDAIAERLPSESVGAIRPARRDEFAPARGCLIHATLDVRSRVPRRKSA